MVMRQRRPESRTARVRVGTAGWSIPRAVAFRFDSAGTHLERYSRRLDCAEINSSFYRPHTATTYAKWRDSTPPDFRFAVKIPRAITHERQLQDAREPFVTFLAQTDGLADKRGPLLLQLPPSLPFDGSVVTAFLQMVRTVYDGPLVCEPRHASWFVPLVSALLARYSVSRVAADPPPVPDAMVPGGWADVVYFRLHGSPRKYWSRYDDDAITTLAARIGKMSLNAQVWCVFDNTASGSAAANACELHERLMVHYRDVESGGFAMPFKSQAQRRKFAQLLVEGKISDQTFEEWNRETGSKKLPERVRSKPKASRASTSARTRRTAKKK